MKRLPFFSKNFHRNEINYKNSVLFLCQILGVFPLAWNKGRYRGSIKFFLISMCTVSYSVFVTMRYVSRSRLPPNEGTMGLVLYLGSTNIVCFAIFFNTFNTFIRQGSLNLFQKRIESSDLVLRQVQIAHHENVSQKYLILDTCYVMILILNVICCFMTEQLNTALENFSYGIVLIFFRCSVWQFSAFCHHLEGRFKSICSCLQGMSFTNRKTYGNRDKVRALILASHNLTTACSHLEIAYTRQLLLAIITSFVQVTSGFYFLVSYLTQFVNDDNDQYNNEMIKRVLSNCVYGYPLLDVVISSNAVMRKAKQFDNYLYQIILNDRTDEFLLDEKLRLHIDMKREVVFTACGFFELDNMLLHSVIASVTTYLVILIQFGESPPG